MVYHGLTSIAIRNVSAHTTAPHCCILAMRSQFIYIEQNIVIISLRNIELQILAPLFISVLVQS